VRGKRSIAVVVLMTMPGTTFAQMPVAGSAKPSRDEVDGSAHSLEVTARDFWIGARVGGDQAQTSPSPTPAAIPGGWEKVDAWPPGERIIITLKSGVRMEGAVKDSSSEDLVLTTPTGNEQRFPKDEVQQVNGDKKDTIVDGLLLGAAIGAGFGVLFGYGRRTFECRAACSIAIGATLFTPVGALVGWLRDRKRNQTEMLYIAP
jgi:hypothetical protein